MRRGSVVGLGRVLVLVFFSGCSMSWLVRWVCVFVDVSSP